VNREPIFYQSYRKNFSEMVKIIVTGHSDNEHGIKASDYGADDYLFKPVKTEELLTCIKERLEDLRNEKPIKIKDKGSAKKLQLFLR